jgi:hypothetical protein
MHGWPISTISAAITAHYLVSAALIAGLPEAYRRFGVGRITLLGVVLAGVGTIAWANAAQPWHLVPALLISGAAGGGPERHRGALVRPRTAQGDRHGLQRRQRRRRGLSCRCGPR